ncbi:MAG: Gfo/Idh/MocA family protein [Ferrovibrionaceae bacterium]
MKLAVVGAGLIGRRHAEIIAGLPGATLAAIVDPAPEAEVFASSLGAAWFADLAPLLDAGVDGVVIATPNRLHAEGAIACLARRLPVLVEKPVADTAEAAARIARAAGATPTLVGHHRRHSASLKAARAAIAEGRVGAVTAVTALSHLLKPDDYFDVAWRRQPGGGPILINLIHVVDDLRYLCGEIVAVQAMASSATRGFAVEDTAVVTLRFASGALGTLGVSDVAAGPWSWELTSGENPFYPRQDGDCYLVAGRDGALAVPTLDLWRYDGPPHWGTPMTRTRLPAPAVDPLIQQMRHFRDVVRGEAEPLVTVADAARSLVVVEAIAEAAHTGRIIHCNSGD